MRLAADVYPFSSVAFDCFIDFFFFFIDTSDYGVRGWIRLCDRVI